MMADSIRDRRPVIRAFPANPAKAANAIGSSVPFIMSAAIRS
jgi:hypothetical protein